MKKFIGLIVLLIVVIGIIFFTRENAKNDTQIQEVSTMYSNETESISVTFDNTHNTVIFSHPSVGTDVVLPLAVSASGTRYANEDESIVFWEHQGEVTIIKDGVEVFKGSVLPPTMSTQTSL